MFLKSEIIQLESLYENIQDETIESFLSEDEVEMIKQKFSSAYKNIRNFVFVPKRHDRYMTSVRFQRLNTPSFNLGDWLKEISYKIRYSPHMSLEVGFSFICHVGRDPSEKTYMFTNRNLATYSHKFSNRDELNQFIKEHGKKKESELLTEVFWTANNLKRFRISGWSPSTLVCNYVWITK